MPPVPQGVKFWVLLTALAVLYPLSLHRKFRTHRADYEFRLLHWFPLLMLGIWIVLATFDQRSSFVHILFLGFFVLWSLPLSLLGIVLLGLFAFHVLRRRTFRLSVLSVLMVLFAAGAIATEVAGLHSRLSAMIFPADGNFQQTVESVISKARSLIGREGRCPRTSVGRIETIEGIDQSSSSSLPAEISTRRPRRLASSGPEDVVIIAVGLLGLYAATLHDRSRKRCS
ncbi:MAG: hypothetical protein PHZ00_02590 [Candidatus Peribacteraceae bacterium]|nr:hypothetical protein [Candidatus Peribacteraceae bacterium]